MKLSVLSVLCTLCFFISCGTSDTAHDDDVDMNADIVHEGMPDDDAVEGDSDEAYPDADVDGAEPEQYQTGGVLFFEHFETGFEMTETVFGRGGFFGIRMFDLYGADHFAVSAIHESQPPYDFEQASGAVYLFERDLFPADLEDAVQVLRHPEGSLNAGFGYAVAGPCDVNGDGYDDIVVSSHLATVNGAFAAGEVIVYHGAASGSGYDSDSYTISHLSDGVLQERDSMTQSLVCGDIDGDGYADVVAGGQNAGADLNPGSTGMIALFRGTESGLSPEEEITVAPPVTEWKQYFGSTLLLADCNGDGTDDIVAGGWGLTDGPDGNHTGGVLIYDGETFFSSERDPAAALFPDTADEIQFGSVIRMVSIDDVSYLAVLAADDADGGVIYLYAIPENGDFPDSVHDMVFRPVAGSLGDGTLSDFAQCPGADDDGFLIAGSGRALATGLCVVFDLTAETGAIPETLRPETLLSGDGFGSAVTPISDSSGGRCVRLGVGIPEHIETVY